MWRKHVFHSFDRFLYTVKLKCVEAGLLGITLSLGTLSLSIILEHETPSTVHLAFHKLQI